MKSMLALVMIWSLGVSAGVLQAEPLGVTPLCSAHAKTGAPSFFAAKPAVGTKATCAVMKHEFVVKADTPFSLYKGRYYPFCCAGCKPKFEKNPSQYAGN
jgi:YHS domain-containing protein